MSDRPRHKFAAHTHLRIADCLNVDADDLALRRRNAAQNNVHIKPMDEEDRGSSGFDNSALFVAGEAANNFERRQCVTLMVLIMRIIRSVVLSLHTSEVLVKFLPLFDGELLKNGNDPFGFPAEIAPSIIFGLQCAVPVGRKAVIFPADT